MPRSNRREIASFVGAGLIIALTLSGPILANIDQEHRYAGERAEQAAEKERQAVAALVLNENEHAIQSESRERRRDQREDSDLDAQWATAAGTIVGAIFGVLGFFGLVFTVAFAYLAWQAARKSARAAIKANRNFVEFSQRQLRGYMLLEKGHVERRNIVRKKEDGTEERTGEFKLGINLTFKNTGQSPVLDFRIRARIGFPKPDEGLPDVLKLEHTTSSVIGPGILHHLQGEHEQLLTDDIIRAGVAAKAQFRVFGLIEYRDIFGVEWEYLFDQYLFELENIIEPGKKPSMRSTVGGNDLRRKDGKPL